MLKKWSPDVWKYEKENAQTINITTFLFSKYPSPNMENLEK